MSGFITGVHCFGSKLGFYVVNKLGMKQNEHWDPNSFTMRDTDKDNIRTVKVKLADLVMSDSPRKKK